MAIRLKRSKAVTNTFYAVTLAIVITAIVVGAATYYAVKPHKIGGATYTVTTTKTVTVTKSITSTIIPKTTTTSAPPTTSQKTITVLLGSGDPTLIPYVKIAASVFQKNHPNVVVRINSVPFIHMVTTALTALQNHAPSPDIILFYPSQASELGPYLLDLTKYLNTGIINKTDIPKSSMTVVYLLDNKGNIVKTFGVPFQQVFGYVLVYRKSLFQNSQWASEFKSKYGFDFNPKAWDTWDKLIKGASFLQEKLNEKKGTTKWALLFPDGLQHALINTYVGIFYSYAVDDSACTDVPSTARIGVQGYWVYFKEVNGKIVPTFNCTSALKALETYKQLIQFEPPITVQAMEYGQLRDLFRTGQYAMVAAWTSFLPIYNNATVSKVAGDLDVVPLPKGATAQAPTYAGINPYSKNIDLDVEFVSTMLSPEVYKLAVQQVGFLPATYTGLKIASQYPATSWVKPFYEDLLKPNPVSLERMAIYNKISNFWSDLTPVFLKQVALYLEGKQSAQETLNNIQSMWLKLMKVSS